MKESQTKDGLTVRWEMGLNKKWAAYFVFPKDDNELRLVPGDELRLKLGSGMLSSAGSKAGEKGKSGWSSVGHVVKMTASEEVLVQVTDIALSSYTHAYIRIRRIKWFFLEVLLLIARSY